MVQTPFTTNISCIDGSVIWAILQVGRFTAVQSHITNLYEHVRKQSEYNNYKTAQRKYARQLVSMKQ